MQKQSASGQKRVIEFGAQDPSCDLPFPLCLGAEDSAEAFANQIGDVFGEELGPQARTLLTHVFRTVQAANSPEERTTPRQAYSFLTDKKGRTRLVAQAVAAGRLPAATSDYWSRQGAVAFSA